MNIENLEKGIISELPQIPFVLDQVGEAIKWAKEVYDEGKLYKVLETSVQVAKWVTTISEPNFYKTYLVIASLISEIPGVLESPNFDKFKSASNSVEKTIKDITLDTNSIEERGCFNSLTIHLVQLARTNEEGLALALFNVLSDLREVTAGVKEAGVKTPVTPQNYITVLGYAYVMSNFRMSNLSLLEYNSIILNDIQILLNNEVIY